MKRGRPLLYQTEEERKKAIRRNNGRILRETRRYCEVCQREYSLGSKINHTNTTKHQRNYYANQPLVEISAQYSLWACHAMAVFFSPVCKNTVGHKNRKMYDSEECPLEKIHFRLIESSESKRKSLISFEFPLKKFLYDFLSLKCQSSPAQG